MKIKRIKKVTIGNTDFTVTWNPNTNGGYFNMETSVMEIGTRNGNASTFNVLCHELLEACHILMNQRYQRPDCDNDYLFSYDHRGFDTSTELFAGALRQFIA